MNRKIIAIKSAKEGVVEAVFATLGVIDKDGDVTLPGFFGKQEVIMLPSHDWDSVPLGKGTIEEQGSEAVAKITMNLKIPKAKDWYEALKFDLEKGTPLTEWSYGFRVLDGGRTPGELNGQQVSMLGPLPDGSPGVKVDEVSPVVVGAGERTHTRSVKKTFDDEADAALATVEAFATRAKALADLRGKDGRSLSAEKKEKLGAIAEKLGEVSESLKVLMADSKDEQAEKEARAEFRTLVLQGIVDGKL